MNNIYSRLFQNLATCFAVLFGVFSAFTGNGIALSYSELMKRVGDTSLWSTDFRTAFGLFSGNVINQNVQQLPNQQAQEDPSLKRQTFQYRNGWKYGSWL